MNKKINVNISNFTCTFMVDRKPLPLLDYFESIVYPAFSDITLYKETKSGNKYHITDLKLVKINDDILALTGKHVKKTILDISPDFDPKIGFTGEDNKEPSAPYSTFILTLNNHRLIYYKNKKGAPSVKNFEGTCRTILIKFVEKKQSEMVDTFKKNDYTYNGIKYKYIDTFRNEILTQLYPQPNLSIIPIESKELVEKKFNEIDKITRVTFTFKPTNNEPINFDNLFEKSFDILEETESNSMKQIFNSPKNKDSIKDAISTSEGKTDYQIEAKTSDNLPITLTPGHVNENFEIILNPEEPIEETATKAYNQLKDKEALNKESIENRNLFNKIKNSLIKLL